MLTIQEAIAQRRSIRSFKPDPVPGEAVEQMLEAARLAPSGSNRQPWRFIVVTDAAEKAGLRRICLDQAFIEQAPVVFVCCADLAAYASAARKQRYQEFIDNGVTATLSGRYADPAYWAKFIDLPDTDLSVNLISAVANVHIAVEHMALTATALGLGTCWVGSVGGKRRVEALFGLPDSMVVVALLPVGYPASTPPPRPRLPVSQILLRPVAGR